MTKSPSDPAKGPKDNGTDNDPNRDIKGSVKPFLTCPEALEALKMDENTNIGLWYFYNNKDELANYSQDGSCFYRKTSKQALELVVKRALELGLDPKLESEFRLQSDLMKSKAPEIAKRNEKFETEDGIKVIFGTDFQRVNSALDVMADEFIMTVPLPRERLIPDRKGEPIGTRVSIENFIVTSKNRLFLASVSEFEKQGFIARIPEAVLEQKWSSGSLEQFIKEGVNVNPWSVFMTLRDTWNHFMDFGQNPGADVANSLYNILTYCYPLFSSIPYLRYTGEKGSAKSKAGAIHEHVDFNTLNAVNLSPASMFRMKQDTRGTLIIDEAESYGKNRNKSENQEALDQVINSGWQASGKVPRIEKVEGRFKPVNYSTFGPCVICSIGNLTETLRDRSYEIILVKTLDRERSKRTVRENDPRWQEIRDSLYLLVMNYWVEIREISENQDIENRLGLIGRELDKAKPLIVIAHFIAKHAGNEGNTLIDGLWEFLKDQHEKEADVSLDSVDYTIIELIEEMVNTELKSVLPDRQESTMVKITLSELAERVALAEGHNLEDGRFNKKTYGRFIKDKLRKLGLAKEFTRGTGNKVQIKTDISSVKTAKERYGLNISGNSNNLSNFSNSSNSSNFSNSPNHPIPNPDPNHQKVFENTSSREIVTEPNPEKHGVRPPVSNSSNYFNTFSNSQEVLENTGSNDGTVTEVTENRNMIETHDHIRDHVPFQSIDLVLGNLKEWGFSIIEYKKIHGKKDGYTCILDGKLADLPPERQAYLRNMFQLKFEGTAEMPHMQIEFSVQNEKLSIDETEPKLLDLRSAILDLIETEAPGSKYHSLTPKAIYDMLVLKFPLVTQSDIAKICKREDDRGVLQKPGLGYRINPDSPDWRSPP
ncbi:MAG: hypothetical protein ACYDAZ_01845 [Thermoplasmataceae archaeon]